MVDNNINPLADDHEDDSLQNIEFRRFILALVQKWRLFFLMGILLSIIGVSLALLLVNKNYIATSVVLRSEQGSGVMIGDGAHFELPRSNLNTLVDTIKLPTNLQEIKDRLKLDLEISQVKNSISLRRGENSNMITIFANGETSKLAVDLANTTADVFVEYLHNMRREKAEKAVKNLDSLVKSSEWKLTESSKELSKFRKKHGIVLPEVETQYSLQKTNSLKSDIEEVRVELASVERQIRQLEKVKEFGSSAGSGAGNFGSNNLMAQQKELNKLRSRYTDDNPIIAKQIAELEATYSTIADKDKNRLMAKRSALWGRLNSLRSQKTETSEKLTSLADNEKGFAAVQQKYAFAKQMLQELLVRREEANAIVDEITGEFQVIERAIPPEYPEGSKAKIIAAAVPLLGLGLMFVLILVFEFFSPKLLSAKEIFALYKLPVIGQHLHNKAAPNDKPIVEPQLYKPIVSVLTAQKKLEGKKVIGVFSAIVGSGQTSAIYSFATALCQRGKKVIILNFTLNKNPQDEITLRDYLEEDDSVDYLIDKGKQNFPDRLSGQFSSPDHLDFWSSELFDNMIEKLGKSYDHILIDTPPAFDYVQNMELALKLDTIAFVVRSGYTKKDQMERVARQFRSLDVDILGAFITDANSFLVRHQEIVTTSAYREITVGRDFIERFILKKFMS